MSERRGSLEQYRDLETKLGEIAEEIRDQGRKRRLLAKVFKGLKENYSLAHRDNGILERELVYDVEDYPLHNLTVAGVDGGVLSKSLHGLDLILVRAVSSVFEYEGGSLNDVEYHPSQMPVPELMNVQDPVDSREFDVLVNLKRQLEEVRTANEVVKYRNPDAMMMDGSVVPQYSNHISSDTAKALYMELLNSYLDFYEYCSNNGILLIGAVKDSRSTRMARIFREKIFPEVLDRADLTRNELSLLENNKDALIKSRDTRFLDCLLEKGERTFVFNYSDSPAPLLEDLGPWRQRIKAFYVKPVPYDAPVRIEFLSGSESIGEETSLVAGLLSALSAGHESCALPTVLIEADARASLAEEEISILCDNISDRLDFTTRLTLRGDRRPF
ncbi:MAG: DNA double-strand break repair nuclease NurA [Candidatus Hadarchaeota archaeon]